MLILMLLAPQMSIIFAISTSNNPITNKIYAWKVAYLSLIFTNVLAYLVVFGSEPSEFRGSGLKVNANALAMLLGSP